jgi:GNAT superfamily N-acetyltransferase
MKILQTACLTTAQKEIVCQLWNQEYPEQLHYHSLTGFDNYLDKLPDQRHFLLMTDDDQIKGWAVTFVREAEKWFAVIVEAALHGQGAGTLLLNHLKSVEDALNGWVVDHNSYCKKDGTPYLSPLRFYEKNGFTVDPDSRLEPETLSAVKINWKQRQEGPL